MYNKKGFTLVEILAVIAIIAILGVAATAGVSSILQRQRQKLAYTAEENISEASLTQYTNKGNTYIKACTDASGSYITISQKNIDDANKFLRNTKFAGRTGEDLYQLLKGYSINGNSDPANKYELDPYIKVNNRSCYKIVTVGELIERGLINDADGMCNKSSLVVVYRKGNAKNTAGIMTSVQESGICKSTRKTESGPVITISPPSNLDLTTSKTINVTVTTETTKLKPSFTMRYGWSNDEMIKPTSWSNLTFTGNAEKKGSATINVRALDKTRYLWIKAGTELDNKNNKTSEMKAGPYAFLPTVIVNYDVNSGNTSSCPATKTVVFTKTYGRNINNIEAKLCTPTKKGYDFKGWYRDGTKHITNSTTVDIKTDHPIVAKWQLHIYNITYDLDGGALEAGKTNPVRYSVETDSFTLNNPSKEGYGFIGWTGGGLSGLTKTVTIPKGSIGDRDYKANFMKLPTCRLSADPGPNEFGWNNTDVKINMETTASPTTYGIAETSNSDNRKLSLTLTNETTVDGKTIYGYVKNAGGEASCKIEVKIDKTPPPAPYIDENYRDNNGLLVNKYGNCNPWYGGCWTNSLTYNQAKNIQANYTYCASEKDHNVNCVVEKLSAIGGFATSYDPDPLSGKWKYITESVTDRCECKQDNSVSRCPGLKIYHFVMYDRAGNTSSIKIYQVNAMCLGYIAPGEEKELFSKYRNHMINSNNFVVNSDRTITVKSCPSKCKNTY